jgi:CheY-like chemotaxis protein
MERKPRILIVDDEEILRVILADLLIDEGFETLDAGSVEEALQSAPMADCIILDLKLSEKNDKEGVEVLEQLWADKTFSTPVIVFSGYVFSDEINKLLRDVEIRHGNGRTIAHCISKSGGFKNLMNAVNMCTTKSG